MLLLKLYRDCRQRWNKRVEVGERQKLRDKLLIYIDILQDMVRVTENTMTCTFDSIVVFIVDKTAVFTFDYCC